MFSCNTLTQIVLGASATLFLNIGQVSGECFAPEPARQICYSAPGATPQNLTVQEIEFTAKYLRNYQATKGNPRFYWFNGTEADNCAEWIVTTKGATMVLAKLVGRSWAAASFIDIAATIDGGEKATEDLKKASLLGGCGTAGGQMGVRFNLTDPLYNSTEFVESGLKSEGIIVKIVRNLDFEKSTSG